MEAEIEARHSGRAMGTTFVVVVHADDAALVPGAIDHIHALEARWSRFLPDSEISILNRCPEMPVLVSADTFQVIQAAVDASTHTDGRFDPTVHDTMLALGYDRTFAEVTAAPPVRAVSSTPSPGVSGIHLDEALHAVTLPAGVRIDLGGIGKGSAADLVTGRLMARGARGSAVSIGGDLRVRGESPTAGGWAISTDDDTLDLAPLRDGGVCTSTTSRRRWSTTAGDVHHLVDPHTGAPTANPIESVTVIGATAQQAEVLTKAAMVAGTDAPALLDRFGVTAFITWSRAA